MAKIRCSMGRMALGECFTMAKIRFAVVKVADSGESPWQEGCFAVVKK